MIEGTVKPDYARPVSITTIAAQKELVNLAWLAVATPIAVGLALQVEALGGFLAGVILSGQLLAVFMSNAGGAWDNAKKVVEDEPRDPANNLGKGSSATRPLWSAIRLATRSRIPPVRPSTR